MLFLQNNLKSQDTWFGNFEINSHPNHINSLEAESIKILKEAVSTAKKPVMLYSIGKDYSVMLKNRMRGSKVENMAFRRLLKLFCRDIQS